MLRTGIFVLHQYISSGHAKGSKYSQRQGYYGFRKYNLTQFHHVYFIVVLCQLKFKACKKAPLIAILSSNAVGTGHRMNAKQ